MHRIRWLPSRSVRKDSIPSTRAMTTTDSVDRLADRSSRTSCSSSPTGNTTRSAVRLLRPHAHRRRLDTQCWQRTPMSTQLTCSSSRSTYPRRSAAASASDPNCFPSTAIDSPAGAGALSVPTGAVGFSGAYYNNILTTVNSVDWNISDKDQFRARFNYSKIDGLDVCGTDPRVLDGRSHAERDHHGQRVPYLLAEPEQRSAHRV